MSRLAGWMLGVFVLALAVRLAFLTLGPGIELAPERLGGDPADYHGIAMSLYEGDGYSWVWPGTGPQAGERVATATRAPVLPVLLAALYQVTGPSPTAGRLLLVAIDGLTAVLLVALGARLGGRRVGIAAGLLAAVHPAMWINVQTLMSEVPTTFLVVASLLAAERVRRSPTLG
ncbi:MAG TPA: glycosyltransferase family 39 protein, partial [Nitriliruptorales bacterium]